MKKRIIAAISTIALLVAMGACDKNRYCLCTTTNAEIPDTTIVNVDRGMKCKNISNMTAIRQLQTMSEDSLHVETHEVIANYKYSCVELDKDTLTMFDSLPR
ncbi:MAG: hypothetical protein SPJ13_01545 [Bacteroidales bacterium]|nr:hypothetical protein [Bacteroidales bacterium]